MIIKTLKQTQFSSQKLIIIMLGVMFFCFSISAALIFQKLLLPHLTSMLAPGTTLTTDSAYFDSVAVEMAQKIKQHGWSSWQLFPNDYTGVHVSILSALYVFFGHDSSLAIPINALFHALGGVLVFMIVVELSSSYLVGLFAGIIASSIFILFPSALNWYGQIHKDGYAIFGVLAMLLIWCKGLKANPHTRQFFFLILLSFLALCFLVAIRAYYFKLLLLFVVVAIIAMFVAKVFFKVKSAWVFFLFILLTFAPAQIFLESIGALSQIRSGEVYEALEQTNGWKWQVSDLLPKKVDHQLEITAKTRASLIAFGVSTEANSMIDIDKVPSSFVEVIDYLPRAFQVALLAPFPTTWLQKVSVTRLLASAEMIVIYISLIGLIPLFIMNRSPQVIFAFFFSSFFLTIYGFIIANVGTLYRVRYPFELIMVLLGVIGWVSYIDKKRPLRQLANKLKENNIFSTQMTSEEVKESPIINRKKAISASVIVGFLTLLGFVGFFLRDVLMAYEFGFGKALDDFFLALLIPMFIVTVFCMPLGAAFVPFLNRMYKNMSDFKLNQVVSHLVSIVLVVTFFVSILLYFLSPIIFHSLQMAAQVVTTNARVSMLLALALIILIFSGVLILGNAVLMTKQRLILPSAAQIIVPVVAILALMLFGSKYGLVSVMAGMVAGQLINLAIIQWHLKKYQISLMPKYNVAMNKVTADLWGQYFPLLASAFFAGVMLPVDTMLASTLDSGNISILNLGMKIVLFISGLLGAVVSNVMLPYFSSIVERSNLQLAKKELSFFILIATFISVPVSTMLYMWSEQIVGLILYSSTFSKSNLFDVKSVMQYSVVQIPFFICNILLLKYATATRHLRVITVSAFVGLLLNVGLSLVLMPKMGVSGIALATSIAMIVSSAIILMMLSFYKHISITDSIVVLLNWMLFLTLVVALHFQSMSSVVMIIITYATLLFIYTKLINNRVELLAV